MHISVSAGCDHWLVIITSGLTLCVELQKAKIKTASAVRNADRRG